MEHFDREEFNCKCGCGENSMDNQFMSKLNLARGFSGIPYHINSGHRCEEHNQEVGGEENSSHLKGIAADISCDNSRQRFLIIKALRMSGFHRIGIAKNFIHVDEDKSKDRDVIWLY